MTNALLQAMQAHCANMRPGFNDGTRVSGFSDAIEFVGKYFAESSNGRKADFDSVNAGSSPASASSILIQKICSLSPEGDAGFVLIQAVIDIIQQNDAPYGGFSDLMESEYLRGFNAARANTVVREEVKSNSTFNYIACKQCRGSIDDHAVDYPSLGSQTLIEKIAKALAWKHYDDCDGSEAELDGIADGVEYVARHWKDYKGYADHALETVREHEAREIPEGFRGSPEAVKVQNWGLNNGYTFLHQEAQEIADIFSEALVNGTHPSHKTRYSDSSAYDEKCDLCGGTDASGDDTLKEPCTK